MEKILRDLAEKDIDKILDNKKINEKNFFILILHYLLENDSINLKEIDDLGNELSKEYKEFLNNFEVDLIESNGEIITVLKSALRKFRKRIYPILEKIKDLKA